MKVSVIIPTKNSAQFLNNCIKSIKNQTDAKKEIIIVDGGSTDATLLISKKFKCTVYHFKPNLSSEVFDAPHKRNYGVKKAKGEFVYYVDADMELPKGLLKEAMNLCKEKYHALIVPEDSFGEGIWAGAKNLERRCYFGDKTIEAPRFFRKKIWLKLGGLDESLAGGRDDGDLYWKLIENGYKVGRTKRIVRHNEGFMTAKKLFQKKFFYGKDVIKYVSKRPKIGIVSYLPIRKSFFKNWRLFLKRPKDSFVFIVMKIIETSGGIAGVAYSLVKSKK